MKDSYDRNRDEPIEINASVLIELVDSILHLKRENARLKELVGENEKRREYNRTCALLNNIAK